MKRIYLILCLFFISFSIFSKIEDNSPPSASDYYYENEILMTPAPGVLENDMESDELNYYTNCSIGKTSNQIALINCIIIDGTGRAPIRNAIVLISDGRIEAVGKDIHIPKEYIVFDLTGNYVLPGFINAHVHKAYNEVNLQNWLNGGVTTVRDLGAKPDGSYLSIKSHLMTNPRNARIISASPVLCPVNGYGYYFINSPDEAEDAVNNFINMGVDIIKISIEDELNKQTYQIFSLEEIQAITKTAHLQGYKVSAHITHVENLDLAVKGGVDDLAHMVVEPLTDNQIRQIIDSGIYWIPTLELWDIIQSKYPVEYRTIAVNNLRRFYKAGGKIALGTDCNGLNELFDNGFPIREVSLMKSAGMSSMDIIIAGTRNAAIVCGREKDLGTLEKGKIADILILNENPLKDIKSFLNPYMIITDGRIFLPTLNVK